MSDQKNDLDYNQDLAYARGLLAISEPIAHHTIFRPDGKSPFPELADSVKEIWFQARIREAYPTRDQILVWCVREVNQWLENYPEWERKRRADLLFSLYSMVTRGY